MNGIAQPDQLRVLDLDFLAAKYAQGVIADTKDCEASAVENLVTKALGVLQENGVYAVMLYLFSRSQFSELLISYCCAKRLLLLSNESGTAHAQFTVGPLERVCESLIQANLETDKKKRDDATAEAKQKAKGQSSDTLKWVTDNVCADLDTLLLTKTLWEQMLTYARYGAKARA